MSSALDEVLGAVRARVEARRQAAVERADAIKRAADGYAAAVEREALGEIASQVGVKIAEGSSAREAAEALRGAVLSLPELSKGSAPAKAKSMADERKPAPRKEAEAPPRREIESDRPLSARLSLPAGVREKVAAPRGAPAREADERGDRETAAAGFPLLQRASQRGRVVVVGGLAKKEKLEWLRARLGFSPEWIATDKVGLSSIRKLEGRILDGHVAAIVVLDGLIGHAHFEPLARATRQTGTLLVYGDKAGKASLEKALEEAEKQLARKR